MQTHIHYLLNVHWYVDLFSSIPPSSLLRELSPDCLRESLGDLIYTLLLQYLCKVRQRRDSPARKGGAFSAGADLHGVLPPWLFRPLNLFPVSCLQNIWVGFQNEEGPGDGDTNIEALTAKRVFRLSPIGVSTNHDKEKRLQK